MEKKLHQEDLSPYLPYGLEGYKLIKKNGELTPSIKGLTPFCINTWIKDSDPYKPILRPLSDLDREIKISDAETYWGMGEFSENQCRDYEISGDLLSSLDYSAVMELIKRHFDVFNLIPNGLAISYNDIKNK